MQQASSRSQPRQIHRLPSQTPELLRPIAVVPRRRPPARSLSSLALTAPAWTGPGPEAFPLSEHPTAQSHACAERATWQAFLNCYLREIDAGTWLPGQPPRLELAPPGTGARLRITLDYVSRTGANRFGAVEIAQGERWQPIAPLDALPLLARDCFRRAPATSGHRRADLLRGVLNSYAQIERLCRGRGHPGPEALADFLGAEQSLIHGHALHPTPKNHDGMADWHLPAYAPELGGRFQLRFFAVAAGHLRAGSALPRPAAALVADIPGVAGAFDLRPGETLIPAHPLQAEALLLDPAVQSLIAAGKLRDLGAAGPAFSATSSLRTVYSPDCPWMLKFSVPVRITNSRRINQLCELDAGVLMARLFRELGVGRRDDRLRILDDPAWLAVAVPGRREGGFEMIFRENPFRGEATRGPVNLVALTAEPLPGAESWLARVLDRSGAGRAGSGQVGARRWFEAYLDCVVEPIIDLYETHGIALEAHQQNVLIDLSDGLPRRAWYRDNQGYYVAESHLDRLAALVPELRLGEDLCYPRDEINDRLAYYLIINQAFGVIGRLGRDGLGEEDEFLDRLAARLDRQARRPGPGGDFARHMLGAPHLLAKGNLLTRAQDIDELSDGPSVYVPLANPIAHRRSETCQRRQDVVA